MVFKTNINRETDNMENNRFQQMQSWYSSLYPQDNEIPVMVSGDASFRKFYRTNNGILMDAPPSTEKNKEFIELSNLYNHYNVHVPKVFNYDISNGFLLVEDLGNSTLASVRTDANQEKLYMQCVDLLGDIAKISTSTLPIYDDKFILRENQIGIDWFLKNKFGRDLTEQELSIIDKANKILIENDLSQPQIAMHRDFHGRNIMYLDGVDKLALVDFQDTVKGPMCYDLVSLLRDCYYEMPVELLEKLIYKSYVMYSDIGLFSKNTISIDEFTRMVDLTGLQRHFKCVGIFKRLALRDNKTKYLDDIPLVIKYIKQVCAKYKELEEFADLF